MISLPTLELPVLAAVGFLDSNHQWRPRKLELQLSVLDSNPDTENVVGFGRRWLNHGCELGIIAR